MAVKAGKILTIGNGFLVSRLQTTGPGSLNIPTETIRETGNELTVAITREIPDLSFDMESLDCTIDTEAVICNIDPLTLNDGDFIHFGMAKYIDVVSPWKAAGTSKTADAGIIWPALTHESAAYRFGVGANATQSFSFRGDSQYGAKKIPYRDVYDGDGTTTAFSFAHTAIKTIEKGTNKYGVNVTVYKADGTCTRLFHGQDFTDSSAGITLVSGALAPADSTIAVCYFSTTSATFAQTIHPDPDVKPGAVKGQDIDLYVAVGKQRTFSGTTTNTDATLVGTGFTAADVGARLSGTNIPTGATVDTYTDATHVEMSEPATSSATAVVTLNPPLIRWEGVQNVEINWRVTLDNDRELGNAHNVSSDYDTPEVSGTITLRPSANAKLFDKLAQVTGSAVGEVSNLLSSNPLEMRVVIRHPDTGTVLKSFQVDAARIQPPAVQARAGAKVEPQFTWGDDTGYLKVYKGAIAA